MERREFLALIPSLAWLWSGNFSPPPPPALLPRTYLATCALAGFQFHEGEKLWLSLSNGDRLDLVREPQNPYDRKAIAVRWRGRMLGYIPRQENDVPARFMDDGRRLCATLAAKRESGDPWRRIEMDLWMEG